MNKKLKKWVGMILGKTSFVYDDLTGEVYKKGPKDKVFVPANNSEKRAASKLRKKATHKNH